MAGNQFGEGNSKLKNVCLDMPSPDMQRLFRQMGRRKSWFDTTSETALQQHVVENMEHNKAH